MFNRLRSAIGPIITANLDPSHFFFQGMDPLAVIRALGNSIGYVHAKDARVDPYNLAVQGALDLTTRQAGSRSRLGLSHSGLRPRSAILGGLRFGAAIGRLRRSSVHRARRSVDGCRGSHRPCGRAVEEHGFVRAAVDRSRRSTAFLEMIRRQFLRNSLGSTRHGAARSIRMCGKKTTSRGQITFGSYADPGAGHL